jgi:predicted dehydrogenase
MNPVGVALIGAGPWGLTLARALARVPSLALRWICDVDPIRLDRARAAHPAARTAAQLDDVLADGEVEAVAVAVDSPRHHAVGMRVLGANRHLLVEKPLALSAADAAELHAEAEARGLVLAVGHLLLHHPAVRRAREIVADGALGDPLCFESTRESVGAPHRHGSAWWTLAPHDVSLAVDLLGAVPVRVSATASAFIGSEDSVTSATLHFADDRRARIRVARFAAEKARRTSITGTRRTLTFDELAPEHPLHVVESGSGALTRVPVEAVDPLHAQCSHFAGCVREGAAARGNGAHAVAVVRVLEAGARSMRAQGAPVEVT